MRARKPCTARKLKKGKRKKLWRDTIAFIVRKFFNFLSALCLLPLRTLPYKRKARLLVIRLGVRKPL